MTRLSDQELDALERMREGRFTKEYQDELIARTNEVATVSDAVLADYLVGAMRHYVYYISETTEYADAVASEAAKRLRERAQ